MKYLFTLNAEGGPLLLVDARQATSWNGADQEGRQYQGLCQIFDANPKLEGAQVQVGSGYGLAWEMAGPGSADIFRAPEGTIMVLRAWLTQNAGPSIEDLAEADPHIRTRLSDLIVPSQTLAMLWAVESGADVPMDFAGEYEKVTRTAIEGSVFALRTQARSFKCFHEKVEGERAQVRRLMLVPDNTELG